MKTPSQQLQIEDYTTSKLLIAASIAKNKNRIQKIEVLLNSTLILVEYFAYLSVFLFLYKWRVAKGIILLDPSTWIKNSNLLYDYLFFLSVILLIYTFMLVNRRLLHFHSQIGFIDEFMSIIKVVFMTFTVTIGLLFLLKTSIIYSRLLIMSYFTAMIIIAGFIRGLKKGIIIYLRKKNILIKNVLIVGAGKVGEKVGDFIDSQKSSGYRLVGYLDDIKKRKNILGGINRLEWIIQSEKINDIYITIPSEKKIILDLLTKIRKYDIDIKIIPELYDFVSTSLQFQKTAAYPYIDIIKTPLIDHNLFVKRFADIIISALGIIVLLPVFIITAFLIKIDSEGPVIFKQKRIGKNGVPFYIFKFRSMVTNAEELKAELVQQNEVDGPVFKIKNDPRVTKIGQYIRKYSIDELPQIFNVLKGEMSLIGPRPPLPSEVEKYSDYQWRRLDVSPGITGLWQISGRSDLSFDEWVNLDIYYIENWSIGLDIKILLRTIPVVIKGKGAY